MFDAWKKLRYVAENKPPVLFKGYMHTESEDHGGGFVSHIATIDPDVAFITGDNKVSYGTATKKTSHFMKYLLAGGSVANLYIKDYTIEMDDEEGTITLGSLSYSRATFTSTRLILLSGVTYFTGAKPPCDYSTLGKVAVA